MSTTARAGYLAYYRTPTGNEQMSPFHDAEQALGFLTAGQDQDALVAIGVWDVARGRWEYDGSHFAKKD